MTGGLANLLDSRLKTDPYHHQLVELEERAHLEASALIWDPRTGKSKATIDTLNLNAARGLIDGALVLAPNGPHENWVRREFPTHMGSNVPYRAAAWATRLGVPRPPERYSSRRERAEVEEWTARFERMLASDDFQVLAVNLESLHLPQVRAQIAQFCRVGTRGNLKRAGFRYAVIADEAHAFRRVSSKWTETAAALFKYASLRRILTATPVTESPLHAYSQFALLEVERGSRGALGFHNFGDFKRAYAIYRKVERKDARTYPQLVGYRDLDDLAERLRPMMSRVTRADVDDMPEVVTRRVEAPLTPDQAAAYTQLTREYRLMLADDPAIAFVEAGPRMTKLQQVLAGYVVDDRGQTRWISRHTPRITALVDEVLTAETPVIVWCSFRPEAEHVADLLRRAGARVLSYHGQTSEAERAEARDLLHPASTRPLRPPCALVATYSSGAGSGLNLSRAKRMVWFGHTREAIRRRQAIERCTEIAGAVAENVDLFAPDTVDEYLLDVLLPGKFDAADAATPRFHQFGETWAT